MVCVDISEERYIFVITRVVIPLVINAADKFALYMYILRPTCMCKQTGILTENLIYACYKRFKFTHILEYSIFGVSNHIMRFLTCKVAWYILVVFKSDFVNLKLYRFCFINFWSLWVRIWFRPLFCNFSNSFLLSFLCRWFLTLFTTIVTT